MGKKKRQYEAKIKAKENNHVSQKSDNRVICPKTGRKKFLYSTLQKALTACKFSKDPQRPYYCKRCFGYHTTSESKEQYYDNLEKRIGNLKFEVVRTEKKYDFVGRKNENRR